MLAVYFVTEPMRKSGGPNMVVRLDMRLGDAKTALLEHIEERFDTELDAESFAAMTLWQDYERTREFTGNGDRVFVFGLEKFLADKDITWFN